MRSKTFLIIFLGIVIPIISLNSLVYFFYQEDFTGDLGRIGQIDFGKNYELIFKDKLEEKKYFSDFNFHDLGNTNCDIMTIGDSFSRGEKKGYQNYLAKKTNKKVINFPIFKIDADPEQMAINLLNSGFFKENPTKILLIESVERFFIKRCLNLNFNKIDKLENIRKEYVENTTTRGNNNKKEDPIFRMENFKFLIRKTFPMITFKSKVNNEKLTKPLFSVYDNTLYYYSADVKDLSYVIDENLAKVNENLNKLAKKCQEKGIILIVMPAVNKYSLYQNYISKKDAEKCLFWDKFSKLNHQYIFVNTYDILSKDVKNGVKDIFLANDTHWSCIGYKSVGEELAKIISDLINKN